MVGPSSVWPIWFHSTKRGCSCHLSARQRPPSYRACRDDKDGPLSSFSNDFDGVDALNARLKAHEVEYVVFEARGGYEVCFGILA